VLYGNHAIFCEEFSAESARQLPRSPVGVAGEIGEGRIEQDDVERFLGRVFVEESIGVGGKDLALRLESEGAQVLLDQGDDLAVPFDQRRPTCSPGDRLHRQGARSGEDVENPRTDDPITDHRKERLSHSRSHRPDLSPRGYFQRATPVCSTADAHLVIATPQGVERRC